MDVVTAVCTVIVGALVFGLVSIVATFPGWIAGRIAARGERDIRANFLVATRPRRWVLWAVSSLVAIFTLNFVYRDGGPAWFVGLMASSLIAQYAAFTIAFAAQKLAPRVSIPGEAVQVIPGEVVDHDSLPVAQPVLSSPTSVEDDLKQAEDEGYAPPRFRDE